MCIEVEAQTNNCKNKASLWTDFKYSFTWLTGMKKLIFDNNNFFDMAILWSIIKKPWIKKWLNKKKLLLSKISFFTPVIHAKKFFNPMHAETLFLRLFAQASTSLH